MGQVGIAQGIFKLTRAATEKKPPLRRSGEEERDRLREARLSLAVISMDDGEGTIELQSLRRGPEGSKSADFKILNLHATGAVIELSLLASGDTSYCSQPATTSRRAIRAASTVLASKALATATPSEFIGRAAISSARLGTRSLIG